MRATLAGLGLGAITNQSGGDDEKDVSTGFAVWNWSVQPSGNNHSITFWIGGKERGDPSGTGKGFRDLLPQIAAFELEAKNTSWWVYALNEIAAMPFVERILFQYGKSGRGIPDVAAHASPIAGYRILFHGMKTVVGGTAAATPFWAGLIARINQGLGRNIGYMNPILYKKIGPLGASAIFSSATIVSMA